MEAMAALYLVIAITIRILFMWYCIATARKKGRDVTLAGFLGFFFGLWAVIGYALAGNHNIKTIKQADLICPSCGSEVTLRTVIKGKDTGKRFYVCNNYPECKGRIRV